MRYNISQELTTTPGGRSKASGPHSAEELSEILMPKIQKAWEQGELLEVEMDGVMGYADSFLDEICSILPFGNQDDLNIIQKTMRFITSDEILVCDILDVLPISWHAIKLDPMQDWILQRIQAQPFGVWYSTLHDSHWSPMYHQIFLQELP